MTQVVSFYQFTPLSQLEALRGQLRDRAAELQITGTLLLASEGLNGMMAGSAASVARFHQILTALPGCEQLTFKISEHAETPFRRLLVKIKAEIITMRRPVDVPRETGAYLDPLEFKRWLDENRDILIVDTRNQYEVALGTFAGAVDPKIDRFSQFPDWVEKNLSEAKQRTIVTFCTGGIRCEKATAFMRQRGFSNVYQLQGGILRYLEQTRTEQGSNHWVGECVVFDKRKAVRADLSSSQRAICHVCLSEIPCGATQHATPAGERCDRCQAELTSAQDRRDARGRLRAARNRKHRLDFLNQQRAAHRR